MGAAKRSRPAAGRAEPVVKGKPKNGKKIAASKVTPARASEPAPLSGRRGATVKTKAATRPAKTPKPGGSRSTRPPTKATPVVSEKRLARSDVPPSRVQRLPPTAPEAREGISPVAVRALPPEPAGSGETRGKYVYCVIQTAKPLSFGALGIGVGPAEVHTVNFKDIAAVVSDTPIAVHEPTRANVLAHERVNETVMRAHTVIPMSFGTVFKTRDDIHELLRSAYDAFKDVLVKMEDKLEFGLKVLWDRDLIVKELEAENEDIRRLKSEITSQKGSTYFARMQYGRLVDAALQSRSERYVHEIFDSLRPPSVASRANRPIGDRMIMNAAFLVRRDAESDFDRIVKAIGAKYDKLTFKYTGPWPPYNFVNIRLKLERA